MRLVGFVAFAFFLSGCTTGVQDGDAPNLSLDVFATSFPQRGCSGQSNTEDYWFQQVSVRLTNDDDQVRDATRYSFRGYLTNGIALSPCQDPEHDLAPMAIVELDLVFRVPGDFDVFEHSNGPHVSTVALFYGASELDRASVQLFWNGEEGPAGEESAPNISINKDSAGRTLTVVQAEEADWSEFSISPTQCQRPASSGKVSAGDVIDCRAMGGTTFTVTIKHIPTNSLVYSTTFS